MLGWIESTHILRDMSLGFFQYSFNGCSFICRLIWHQWRKDHLELPDGDPHHLEIASHPHGDLPHGSCMFQQLFCRNWQMYVCCLCYPRILIGKEEQCTITCQKRALFCFLTCRLSFYAFEYEQISDSRKV